MKQRENQVKSYNESGCKNFEYVVKVDISPKCIYVNKRIRHILEISKQLQKSLVYIENDEHVNK